MGGPFELVIFDCDGVLVDSERLSTRLDVELLQQLGWPLTESEIIERWVGRTEGAMRAEIEAHLGRDVSAEWAAFSERYVAAFAAGLEPVAGVIEVVDAIQAAGLTTCVASSGDHAKIRRNLAKTGLLDRFDGRIFSGDDVLHGKPAPDLFLHAAAAMGVAPDRCAVIEDSRHGVAAARAAGMRAYGYAGGVTPGSALAGLATSVFDEMRDLPGLILG
ncbi:MAG TPA: HAD-IA family hydrolase [Patescibacteria group bacterium]|nr:HAD-IA family hydrolase [Patescibacteria group bacterium]